MTSSTGTITVDISDALQHIQRLKKAYLSAFERGMNAFGEDATGHARETAHVETGRLRGNMKLQPGNLEWTIANRTLRISRHSSCNYALCNEYGSRKMAARPFMKPTIEWAAGGPLVERIAKEARGVT